MIVKHGSATFGSTSVVEHEHEPQCCSVATSCLRKHEAQENKEAACVCRLESTSGKVEFFDEGKAQF